MRTTLMLASAVWAAMALAAAAQSSGAGSGTSSGAAAPSVTPHMATSHAQTAQRLMHRGGTGAEPDHDNAPPKVQAAAEAADKALAADPTVRAMVDGSMSKPPSLAGGSPGVAPPPSKAPQ